ncbi:uncharacterized protein LOC115949712 [Quercus lobata]|uniref:uncharacterized protein LOC115949712 n=1 Tax=Quercus lobata TaxID=97700 RepID=UPI001244CA5F|nr:uncharacterized protein LOC115949712 [Quercus lobata]
MQGRRLLLERRHCTRSISSRVCISSLCGDLYDQSTIAYKYTNKYGYNGTKRVCLEKSLAMTLVVLSHAEGNKMVQDRFQHSGETVHRDVAMVVTFRDVSEHIQHSDRYWPHFKGCIGAIDGVHVPMVVPVDEQHPYYGKKGITTTNCMCACDFDMKFTFACVE